MAHTYVIIQALESPTNDGTDSIVTIVGTVDGVQVTIGLYKSEITANSNIIALRNLLSARMLSALPAAPVPVAPSVQVAPQTFSQ